MYVCVHICACIWVKERVGACVLKPPLLCSLRRMHGNLCQKRMRTTQSRGSCVCSSGAVG